MAKSHTRIGQLAVALTVAGMVVGLAPAAAAAGPTPSVVVLRELGGGYSFVNQINDAGMAVGQSVTAGGESHAVRWDRHNRISDLGMLGGIWSTASYINRSGMVAGDISFPSGKTHAARWDRQGRGTDLGTLPGGSGSYPFGINDSGTVVGTSDLPFDATRADTHAVRWDRRGHITDLGAPGVVSMAYGINNTGTVVGASGGAPDQRGHAARWDRSGRMTFLDDLPGSTTNTARLISDSGIATGDAAVPGDGLHAVRWDQRGRVTDLGPIPDHGTPHAIRDDGTIVGTTRTPDGFHAARWNPRGVHTDLGTLGGSRSEAYAINARGTIVGSSFTTDDEEVVAARWDRHGRITALPLPPGGTRSEALSINDKGWAVGIVFMGDAIRAVLWR